MSDEEIVEKSKVALELSQLQDKIFRLSTYNQSRKFPELTPQMQTLLEVQLQVMLQYRWVLQTRLNIWDQK